MNSLKDLDLRPWYYSVTQCAGRVSGSARPHQLCWGDRETGKGFLGQLHHLSIVSVQLIPSHRQLSSLHPLCTGPLLAYSSVNSVTQYNNYIQCKMICHHIHILSPHAHTTPYHYTHITRGTHTHHHLHHQQGTDHQTSGASEVPPLPVSNRTGSSPIRLHLRRYYHKDEIRERYIYI